MQIQSVRAGNGGQQLLTDHTPISGLMDQCDTKSEASLQATAELADIAAGLPQLRAFVHVSTAYVNGFLPPGSRVEERFYDARCEGQSIQHAAFVQRVFSMSVRKVHSH